MERERTEMEREDGDMRERTEMRANGDGES